MKLFQVLVLSSLILSSLACGKKAENEEILVIPPVKPAIGSCVQIKENYYKEIASNQIVLLEAFGVGPSSKGTLIKDNGGGTYVIEYTDIQVEIEMDYDAITPCI